MISASGVLVAIAWVINSVADSLFLLYLGAAIGGIGAGVIYGGAVGNALKWFPDRRGLAAGLTAAGFGAGSALTVIPIANMIAIERLSSLLFSGSASDKASWWCLVGLLLRAPETGEVAGELRQCSRSRRDYESDGGAQDAGVLRHVRDVRGGRRGRADGDRATGAHCQ